MIWDTAAGCSGVCGAVKLASLSGGVPLIEAQRRPLHRAAHSLPQVRQALQLQAVHKQRQPLSTDTSKAWPETGNKSTASCWLLPAWLLLMQMMGNPQACC